MSPVAKKHSVDQPVRTESTESITDCANKSEVIGFLPILTTEAWENTELSQYTKTASLTNSCLWVLWHFFQIEHKKLLIFTPKLPTAALNNVTIWCFMKHKVKKEAHNGLYNLHEPSNYAAIKKLKHILMPPSE